MNKPEILDETLLVEVITENQVFEEILKEILEIFDTIGTAALPSWEPVLNGEKPDRIGRIITLLKERNEKQTDYDSYRKLLEDNEEVLFQELLNLSHYKQSELPNDPSIISEEVENFNNMIEALLGAA